MKISAALLGAYVLFLWMFLAADPLDQIGALEYAAQWRHGMAGNSPLYMPGFFAVAIVTWIWAVRRTSRRMWFEGSVLVMAAIAIARLIHIWCAPGFSRGPLPAPAWRATIIASYTLLSWSVFVIACQRALTRSSLWPFLPVPALTFILVTIRPWTVDDLSGMWWTRLTEGDPAAVLSLVIWSTLLAAVFAPMRSSGLHKRAPARRQTQ